MAYYRNLREHIAALEKAGKLQRITSVINKDTELHPLVRLQFRGLPESERKAFFFDNIVDARGKHYSIPLVVCTMAASRDVYAIGMQCRPEEIGERWVNAQLHPIPARLVASGPVQEVVRTGAQLREPGGGLDALPIPISTPGFDNAPYFTSAHWISKDPETGIRNVGNYRGQLKSPLRTGMFPASKEQDIAIHWSKCKERGIPLQAAAVLGVTPNISFVAVTKLPYGLDELAVAGGMAGEAIELVKCKTIDLEVPAHAEIVVEGFIPTDETELEAPFGEFTGYMGQRENTMFFNVTCITQRRDPIYQAFLSQFPPSESSKIRQIGFENAIYKYLKHDCQIAGLLEVALHESSGSWGYCVLKLKKTAPDEPARALEALSNFRRGMSKVVVAVDEDIDARDADAVNWAVSYRMQPHRDTRIFKSGEMSLDPSLGTMGHAVDRDPTFPRAPEASTLSIDATIKYPYPPVSLPRKPFMEHALELWQREGLPKLQLKEPWYGYELGFWGEEEEAEAQAAVRGEYFATGEKLAGRRRKI